MSVSDDSTFARLADLYLSDAATPEEREAAERYFAERPVVRERLDRVRVAMEGPVLGSECTTYAEVRTPLLARLDDAGPETPSLPVGNEAHRARDRQAAQRVNPMALRAWRPVNRFLGAIAVAGVVLVAVLAHRLRPDHVREATTHEYHTAAGERATIPLEQGNLATLGPETRLLVTKNPSDETTVIEIEGQALFSVTSSVSHPFIVRSANSVARVLGTQFMVRRYPSEKVTQVAVTEGRVSLESAVQGDGSRAVLGAKMLGAIDDSGRVTVTPNIAIEDYTGWTTGRLVFRQTPVRDIVAELNRAYGSNIQLADSTFNRRALTWTVSVTKLTLSDVLTVLTGLLDAHVVRSNTSITIVPGDSVHHRPIRSGTLSLENAYGR